MIASLLTEMLLSGRKPAKRKVFNYNGNAKGNHGVREPLVDKAVWKKRWFQKKNDQFEAIDLGTFLLTKSHI